MPVRTSLFHRVLVATDLTKTSAAALRMALDIARANDASLFVIHVVRGGRGSRPSPINALSLHSDATLRHPRPEIMAAERAASRQLRAAQGFSTRPPVRVLTLLGSAAPVVMKVARALDVGLIVVGTAGGSMSLGLTAAPIVRAAKRPVLVVPSSTARARAAGTAKKAASAVAR